MTIKKRWTVRLGWLVVAGTVLLSLTVAIGQRTGDNRANQSSNDKIRRFRSLSPNSPNVSRSFNLTGFPSIRSRQEGDSRRDIVWIQPVLSGRSVAFSPDGQLLATTAVFGFIAIYRVSDGNLVRVLVGHTGEVETIS
ncbi:MAG: hypothetical protein NZ937_06945, partial [Armatimonadetes bacterium]|nr:hypothetical protein [Armatimonadota bacterium]